MLKDLHISHLTGSATVVKNGWFTDLVLPNNRRFTAGQMFFKPYESKEEFVFCARNTVQPLIILGLAILDPLAVVIAPVLIASVSLGFLFAGGISKAVGNEKGARMCIDFAEELFSRICQAAINLVVLPLTALALLTRSISTGLKAADICNYDEPRDDPSPSFV